MNDEQWAINDEPYKDQRSMNNKRWKRVMNNEQGSMINEQWSMNTEW